MSILYCATEVGDGFGAAAGSTTAGGAYYNDTWVSQGINIPDDRYWGFAIPTTKDVWLAFDYNYYDPDANINADGQFLHVMTDTGLLVMRLQCVDGSMRVDHYLNGSSATSTNGIRFYDHLNCLCRFDIHFEYDVASSGTMTITFYIDGIVRAKLDAGTLSTVDSGIAGIRFGCYDLENGVRVSSIIVADEDTRGMVVTELEPDGAGNYSAWDGDYTSMGEAGQGSGIESNSNGDRESWTLDAFGGPAGAVGMRVVNQIWGYPGGSGVSQIDSFLRISSTDYDSGAQTPTPGIPLTYEWTTNPATTAIWDTTAIGLLEAGVEAVT